MKVSMKFYCLALIFGLIVCSEGGFRFRSFRSVRRVGGGSYGGGYSDDSGTNYIGAIIGGISGCIVIICAIVSCVCCCSEKCKQSDAEKNQGQVWSVKDGHVVGLSACKETEGKAPPYNMATQGNSPADGLATPGNYPSYNGATLEGGAPYMTTNAALPYPPITVTPSEGVGYTNHGYQAQPKENKQS